MENITISGIKNTDEFKSNKSKAWNYILGNGDFNIDDFPPEQYKYFDKLLQLYSRLNDGRISEDQAKSEDEKNYSELENYIDEKLERIQDRLELAHNRQIAHDEITKCEKSNDIKVMFESLALATGKFIGDNSFAERQKKKIHERKLK